jgi:hypothetical protein
MINFTFAIPLNKNLIELKPSQTTNLHYEILVKKKMLMELCAGNYETSDGVVNGVDGIFEDFTKIISKSFVWIHFHNPKIGHNTQIIFLQIYDEFPRLDKQWTPIERKIAEIQISSNPSHIITRIQFSIQLTIAQIIHNLQGLILDRLAFDLTNVTKHGPTYIALSKVRSKKNCIYFLHY